MRWKQWTITLLVLIVCIVIIDYVTETHAIAASLRFLWGALVAGLISLVRTLEVLIPVVARRRAWRLATDIPASIGFGYLAGLFLSGPRLQRSQRLFAEYRTKIFRTQKWWQKLVTWQKFAIVIVLIALQIALFPRISKYVVVFPVSFMVPVFSVIAKRLYGMVADSIFGITYRRYCGRMHKAVVHYFRSHPLTRACSRRIGILRLQHATAWRMWRHNACYRNKDGELHISVREPLRLWRRGELDKYIGKPLFASKRRECENITNGPLAT